MSEQGEPERALRSGGIDRRSISVAGWQAPAWSLMAALGALALALVALAEYVIWSEREHLLAAERRRLAAVAGLKANLLERWMAERSADVAVSARGLAGTMEPLWTADRGSAEVVALVARLEYLREAYDYQSVAIYDLEGNLFCGTPLGVPSARRALELPSGSAVDEPRISWSAGSPGGSSWQFDLEQPLAVAGRGGARGWLVLSMDPTRFLGPVLDVWPGVSNSVESVLVSLDPLGAIDSVLGSGANRTAAAVDRSRLPLGSLLESALRGERGAVEATDERGATVLAHLVTISGTPWTLIAKVDRADLLSMLTGNSRLIRGGMLLAFALTMVLGAVALRRSRRLFEIRAAKADQRFRALFAGADEGVLLLDGAARILDANPGARAMLGLGEWFEAGRPITDFFAPGELAAQPLRLAELAERGTLRTQRQLRRGNGEEFPAVLQSVSLPDGRLLTMAYDLSDVRRAEERERRAKRMARFGIWDWDPRSDSVHWDEETFLVLGYDPTSDLPSRSAWLERIHPDDRERVETTIRRALADEEVFDFEHRVALPGNRLRWVRCVADVIRSEAGEPLRVDGAIQDVTARRVADAELVAAQTQLAEAQKMEAVGRLAGSIAHDFNNVVGVISGFAELAELELREDDPTRTRLSEIRRAAGRAADLTRQLLAFARRKPPELRVVPFDAIVAEAKQLLGQVFGADVELDIVCPSGVGSVRADPAQVVQGILNLALNSRDAMPNGGRFALRCRKVEPTSALAVQRARLQVGSSIELTVEDTGSGMDAATLERCFEPFFTTKAPGVGTGLGLSSIKRALEVCGGAIEVTSEPGAGTRFTLWFPVVDEVHDPAPPPEAAGRLGRGERVLVVDDAAQMREIAGSILTRAGFRVSLAPDSEAALERLDSSTEEFDLLLTDVVMPRLSGRELAARVRTARPGLPVLFMTGHAGLQPDGQPFELPHGSLIEKPFAGAELVRRVRAALDASAAISKPESVQPPGL